MPGFDKIDMAALEGALSNTPTLAPLVDEATADAKTAYEECERELAEAERELAEYRTNPVRPAH